MRKSFISIGSAALALMMFGASIPAADAAPLAPAAPVAVQNDVIQVRDSQMGDRRDAHPGWSNGEQVYRHRGWHRGWDRGDRGWDRGYRDGWYNGHRGYRDWRPGYRHYNGYWFPGAAFATGAIIGGVIASQPRYVERRYVAPGMSRRHVEYCMAKYRSYRPSDDTYQPSYGPRRRCR